MEISWDMSNELGPDEHIEEFVSGDPKNYTYRTVTLQFLMLVGMNDGGGKMACE
jgi:hypothetical protein